MLLRGSILATKLFVSLLNQPTAEEVHPFGIGNFRLRRQGVRAYVAAVR